MEFTDEEVQNILGAFKALKVKPKADIPEYFAKWISDFTASMGAFPVKEEPASSHATASIASGHIHVTFPLELRISVFSGEKVKFLKENSVSHLSNNQQSYGSRFRTDNTMKKRDRTCWRCGQVGHIASACRVRLDHSKRDLNSMRPMAGGKQ
ncbi:hypothetical protein ACJMK2_035526 [Sinanodonta woodiana]|uniref:CCHC-type domain-containing protein n=1 Tax=Sinanodonta woodiana TaxID=1069815 RepID=A0ABD3WYP8_SINWO